MSKTVPSLFKIRGIPASFKSRFIALTDMLEREILLRVLETDNYNLFISSNRMEMEEELLNSLLRKHGIEAFQKVSGKIKQIGLFSKTGLYFNDHLKLGVIDPGGNVKTTVINFFKAESNSRKDICCVDINTGDKMIVIADYHLPGKRNEIARFIKEFLKNKSEKTEIAHSK